MKKHKLIAALLSLSVVLAAIPIMTDTAEAEDTAVPASAWQPKPTKTVSSNDFPITIGNGEIVQIDGSFNYTANAGSGTSPITIADGATAKIIINGNISLKGADANGTTGATAAIHVPENSSLTIYSAHDEELSNSKATPKDTLTVTGGNAAAGANGIEAKKEGEIKNGTLYYHWYTGKGGNGGGGAAAAIGGNGGSGGNGAANAKSDIYYTTSGLGYSFWGDYDDNPGEDGGNGAKGTSGTGTGKINISGRLTVNATGGKGGKGGNGGAGCGGLANTRNDDTMMGGCGGGGGGGGGLAAPTIGAGGAGGSGGGAGGMLSSDHHGNVQGCGGGGGAGGWPNGGGGGGGGAECSKAENRMDNSSKGGAGGPGGAAGATGISGDSGTQTGTKNHGLNDARPGNGGAGGGGISAAAASGGAGGKEKDNKYNGGKGGSSGAAVARTSWHTQGNLVLSTANNLNLISSLTYNYGDGQGYGSMTAITPNVIYDLMDCKVNLASCTYPGADSKATTKILSITYDATTDRDGIIVGTERTLAANRAQITSYTGLRHVDKGQVTVTGNNDTDRISAVADQSVVGSTDAEFTINKAKLSDINVNGDLTNIQADKAVSLSVTGVTASNATVELNNICTDKNGTKGTPTITWSIDEGAGTLSDATGAATTFTPTGTGQLQLTVTISGMNDYEDYTKTISLAVGTAPLTAKFSTANPHPRKDITVKLPSDIGDATYQWYYSKTSNDTSNATAITGATSATYAVTNNTIGQYLSVKVTPQSTAKYSETTFTVANPVETHKYSSNGFCTVCDEYQPADVTNSSYQITNGGNLFWFAALVNNDPTHAEFANANPAASAKLTADIDLEGDKNRIWEPIGNISVTYTGTFDGTGHTISNMHITSKALYVGLFGNVAGGTIKDFTISGEIQLPQSPDTTGKMNNANYIGGAVGYINGGSISGITSNVTIQNEGGLYHHVGGIIGHIHTAKTTVTKCIFAGELHMLDKPDCFGGVVGYGRAGAQISYCANLGVVAAEGDAGKGTYIAGILGYTPSADTTVENCYNYGEIRCIGGEYVGAIIGFMNYSTSEKIRFQDNYYLDSSAPSGFGSKSLAVAESEKPKAISKSAFESGQVCYLVNGKKSSDDDAVWRQNIDNNKQNDGYPLFTPAIVYLHSDGVYSNYPESVSVDISWGSMSFEYQKGEWSPYNHAYDAGWVAAVGDDEITIKNKSNVAVIAGFNFTPNDVSNLTGLVGTISGENSLRLEKGASTTATLSLSSNEPTADLNNVPLGTITITITAAGGNN